MVIWNWLSLVFCSIYLFTYPLYFLYFKILCYRNWFVDHKLNSYVIITQSLLDHWCWIQGGECNCRNVFESFHSKLWNIVLLQLLVKHCLTLYNLVWCSCVQLFNFVYLCCITPFCTFVTFPRILVTWLLAIVVARAIWIFGYNTGVTKGMYTFCHIRSLNLLYWNLIFDSV